MKLIYGVLLKVVLLFKTINSTSSFLLYHQALYFVHSPIKANMSKDESEETQNKRQKTTTTTITTIDAIEFLSTICGALKNIKRTGWVRNQVPLPESDADHMHRCSMMAMLVTNQSVKPEDDYTLDNERFHPSNINGTKLLRMALTHDLCESLAGDITPFCSAQEVSSKQDKEHAAMEQIRSVVGDPLGKELFELWKEYEELKTPEAIYCKDIDKFEMVMQAYEYEKLHLKHKDDCDSNVEENNVHHAPMRTFFRTTNSSMKTPLFRRLDKELRMKRELMLKDKDWEVTDSECQSYKEEH